MFTSEKIECVTRIDIMPLTWGHACEALHLAPLQLILYCKQ